MTPEPGDDAAPPCVLRPLPFNTHVLGGWLRLRYGARLRWWYCDTHHEVYVDGDVRTRDGGLHAVHLAVGLTHAPEAYTAVRDLAGIASRHTTTELAAYLRSVGEGR